MDMPTRLRHGALSSGPASPQTAFDILAILRILRRRKSLILLALAATLGLALAYVLFSTPKYTANVVILSDPREQTVLSSEAVLSGIGADAAAVESQVELIKSTTVAERVIDKMSLATDPEFNRPSLLGTVLGFVRSGGAADEDTSRRKLIDAFLKSLDVRRRGMTYIIEVAFSSSDPKTSAAIANAVADAYIEDQQNLKFSATSGASDWLQERAEVLREAVRDSDRAVTDFKVANNILDIGGEQLNLRETEEVNRQLVAAKARTAEAKAKLQQVLDAARPGGDPSAISAALESKVLQDLRAQDAAISRREALLSSQLKPRHPSLVTVRAQIDSIRDAIRAELKRIAANAEIEHQIARDYQGNLEKRLAELQNTAQRLNEQKVKLAELERDQQANRRLYDQLVAREKETSEQKPLQKADARIVARALPPVKASGPGAPLLLVLAGFIGLGGGAMLAFVAESMDRTYRTADALAKDVGRRCLSLLPRAPGSVLPVRANDGWEPFSDAIHLLLRRLFMQQGDGQGWTLLVTSALPGEGKSTVASNIARQVADYDGRALLVADAKVINAIAHNGALRGTAPLASPEARSKAPGLFVLDRTAFDLSLASSSDASRSNALAELAAKFDLIVIDGRSILAGQDGAAEAYAASSLLLVVEWGATPQGSVTRAVEALDANAKKLAGCVLNKVDRKRLKLFDPDNYAA